MKQTADFQRGVGLCAKETKTFLKHHVFDRSKINALFQKIEQRIGYISEHSEAININTFGGVLTRNNILDSSHIEESANGVLLDLSMKQNRLGDETSYNYNSNTIHSLCKNLKKREILDKIRKKILDKRRITATTQNVVQNELVWRPWRY